MRTRSNDFVLERGEREAKLFKTDISDWRITFVDTGLNSAIGERLRRVRRFVEDEPMFLANYADVFTNAPLPDMIAQFEASSAVASLLAVPPQSSHHVVDISDDGLVTKVTPMRDLRQWENGGYFIFRPEIFEHLNEGEDVVEDAVVRLVSVGRVLAFPYKGYWSPADTVKERVQLEEMYLPGLLARGWSGIRSAREQLRATALLPRARQRLRPWRRSEPSCWLCNWQRTRVRHYRC